MNIWVKEAQKADRDRFNRIAEVTAKELENVTRIYLDEFTVNDVEYAYIVVDFKGLGKCVRNATGNSLTCNIREMAKLLDGGYYDEVIGYLELKGQSKNG